MDTTRLSKLVSGHPPQRLRDRLVHSDDADVKRRRGVIGLSLLGVAAMGAVSLLQTGALEHLPDPPGGLFDSDSANLSPVAYQFGLPDATLAVAGLAANIPIAASGGPDRARRRPWYAVGAAAFAAAQAAGAAKYFYEMAAGKEPWCPYCIVGAVAEFGVLALTLPEAVRALRRD